MHCTLTEIWKWKRPHIWELARRISSASGFIYLVFIVSTFSGSFRHHVSDTTRIFFPRTTARLTRLMHSAVYWVVNKVECTLFLLLCYADGWKWFTNYNSRLVRLMLIVVPHIFSYWVRNNNVCLGGRQKGVCLLITYIRNPCPWIRFDQRLPT